MTNLLLTYLHAVAAWLRLPAIGHGLLRSLLFGVGCLLIIGFFERRSGRSLAVYTSRHFVTDVLYRVVFIVYLAWLYNPLQDLVRQTFPALDRSLLSGVRLWIALPVYWLVFDFLSYWIHRIQHSRYWWRFHRVHHSQEHMSFASGYRNHPIDQLLAQMISMVPSLLLGAPAIAWVPYSFLLTFIDACHHSNLPWRFGPARLIFVSPVFHMAHHSTDPAIRNRNFGGLLSVWDFIFGTAYDADALPTRTGVEGWRVRESFWAHLVSPFSRHAVVESPSPPPPGR